MSWRGRAADGPPDRRAGLVDQVTASSECITDPEVFDTFQSLLKCVGRWLHSSPAHPTSRSCASSLPATALSSLHDVLVSAFDAEIVLTGRDANPTDHAAYRSHKPALESFAWLLLWFVQMAEKRAHAGAGGEGDGVVVAAAARKGAKGKGKGATKGKGPATAAGAFDWLSEIPPTLEVMAKALKLRTEFIWQTTPERDAFVR